MKVYAEYFENGQSAYRRKTLLCFGDSTKLLGSAILKNPGSAEVSDSLQKFDEDFISKFYLDNHHLKDINLRSWKIFTDDPTIRFLEKIFNGYYIGQEKRLNGVIQLFNCFYYQDQNINQAIMHLDESADFVFNEFDYLLDKPVYFGWGSQGKTGQLKYIAKQIFDTYHIKKTSIYNENFEENAFLHPQRVNMYYKSELDIQNFLTKFFNELY